ncbi:hypothetical protein VTK26DRAFT_2560 [Humicola hyalothermophila]
MLMTKRRTRTGREEGMGWAGLRTASFLFPPRLFSRTFSFTPDLLSFRGRCLPSASGILFTTPSSPNEGTRNSEEDILRGFTSRAVRTLVGQLPGFANMGPKRAGHLFQAGIFLCGSARSLLSTYFSQWYLVSQSFDSCFLPCLSCVLRLMACAFGHHNS